ncbi:MAG TPA: isoprenylcysteine carboxylmethyltransferase family protein [Alphaproteobacteria bacterium]|nr:isoprenylcysteine carboxylmethyltransferase family protein [Alphaproteobacteria bacterium]
MPSESAIRTDERPRPSKDIDPAWLIDTAMRGTLGVGFALIAGFYASSAIGVAGRIERAAPSLSLVAEVLSIAVIAAFTLLMAWLFVIRLRPLRKSHGVWPRVSALVGGFLNFSLLLLPRIADLPIAAKLFSSALVISGNALAVAILFQLGRSFSIMPEARRLVTSGAYGIVRHPLYLAEFVATVGVGIQFMSAWAVAIVVTQFAFQIARMRNEERVLTSSFPEYDDYRRRTARLIPGIY